MKLFALLLAIATVLSLTVLLADIPSNLEEAAESADGVIMGYSTRFGTGGFPFMDFIVIETLKGPNPGEKISVALPQEAIEGVNIFEIDGARNHTYIIPYRGPADDKGRFAYVGPKLDSMEIAATAENARKIKPGSFNYELPSFEQAVKEADLVVLAVYMKYDPNEELDRFYFQAVEVLKGHLAKDDLTVILKGKYLYWFTRGGTPEMQTRLNPLLTRDPRILCLRRVKNNFYYAGPEFTSPRFPSNPANLAELRRLLTEKKEPPPADTGLDWTWWIVGAIAAVLALIAARLVSKIDYKYDRRRERLEKLRAGSDNDSDTDPGRDSQ
jgi:hypothetical protein